MIYIFLIVPIVCFSEENVNCKNYDIIPKQSRFWVGVGGGMNSLGSVAFDLTGTAQYHGFLLSLSYSNNQDYAFFDSPKERLNEMSINAGTAIANKWITLAVSSGVAVVSGVLRGKEIPETGIGFGFDFGREYESRNILVPGFSSNLQIIFTPFSNLGLGINTFVNLNKEKNFTGVIGNLYFGMLR